MKGNMRLCIVFTVISCCVSASSVAFLDVRKLFCCHVKFYCVVSDQLLDIFIQQNDKH